MYRVASAIGGSTTVNVLGSAFCNGGCYASYSIYEISGTSAQLDQTGSYYSVWTGTFSVGSSGPLQTANEFAVANCVGNGINLSSGPDGGFTGTAEVGQGGFNQVVGYQLTSSTAQLTADWVLANNTSIGCTFASYY